MRRFMFWVCFTVLFGSLFIVAVHDIGWGGALYAAVLVAATIGVFQFS